MTRTFVFGECSEEIEKLYNIVLGTNEIAINCIRSGIPPREADRVSIKLKFCHTLFDFALNLLQRFFCNALCFCNTLIIRNVICENKIESIGFDSDLNHYDYLFVVNNLLKDIKKVDITKDIESLRAIKSKFEIECITKAQRIAEKSLEQVKCEIKVVKRPSVK